MEAKMLWPLLGWWPVGVVGELVRSGRACFVIARLNLPWTCATGMGMSLTNGLRMF